MTTLHEVYPADGVNSHTSTGLRRAEDLPTFRVPKTPLRVYFSPLHEYMGTSACGLRNRKRQTVTLNTPSGTSISNDGLSQLGLKFSYLNVRTGVVRHVIAPEFQCFPVRSFSFDVLCVSI